MATFQAKLDMGKWMSRRNSRTREAAQQPMPHRKPRASGYAYWAFSRHGELVRLYECSNQQEARELAKLLGNSAADEADYLEDRLSVTKARREMRRRRWNEVEVIRREV
jgi:hypothetical protein